MQFAIGEGIVHPHRGPGRIVDVESRELLDGKKQYYVVDIPVFEMTVHVPVRKAADLGVRSAMSKAKAVQVLATLRSLPDTLAGDYKVRQSNLWEKIRTGGPVATAEAVRDLTWRRHNKHLTKNDAEILKRCQDFLAGELALVLGTDVAEANGRIESALDLAVLQMKERQERRAEKVH
jgi:CarD family transcriptional regulator